MALARADFSAWKDSTRVFINASASGANVASKLTHFPLLLRLNASVLDFSALAAGGRDLRFATKDGTLLSHEIESFNPAAKEAVVWIKIPVIDSLSASQYFVMYWNNPAAADISNGAAVFDTADGYAGVWHLNDAPGEAPGDTGASKAYRDATRNGNHGDDFVSAPQDTGAIGAGQAFDGFDDRIQVPSPPSLQLRGPLSLSIWCRAVSLKPAVDGDTLNALIRKGDDNPNSYQLAVIGGYVTLALDADDNTGVHSKEKLIPGRYYHVAASYEGKSAKLYINGAFDSEFPVSIAAGALSQDDKPLQIGGRVRNGSSSSHDQWHGSLDEARISRLSHPAAYFKMSYENQKAGSNVLSFSAFPLQPILPLTSWAHARKILLNTSGTGANVAGTVSDFPLLVRLNADLFDFSQAKADGSDLRFADKDGQVLAHSIERWDAAGKAAEIWVSLPKVEGNSAGGYITMHWGLAGAPDAQNPAAVFDTATGFAGVWHLHDGAMGNFGTPAFRDQTANRNDGMDFAIQPPSAAVVGNGQAFSVPSDRVEVRYNPSLALKSALTLSAWIKVEAWNTAWASNNLIFRKGYGAPIAYDMSVKEGRLKLFLDEFDSLGTIGQSVLETGKWYHVAAAWGDGLVRLYVNGKPDLAAPAERPGTLSQDTLPLFLGSRNPGSETTADWFNGALDEMQVSRIARSPDWIRLAYENQKPNSRFTVHEGYEGLLPPAENTLLDNPITARGAWTYDTILAPGAGLAEKGTFRLSNDGISSIRVVIKPAGDTVADGVTGAEALIRIIGTDAAEPFVNFALDSSIAAERHAFKLIPGTGTTGRLIDLGEAAKGAAFTGSGSWIFALDTLAPVVRVLDQGVNSADSSWILLSVDDNTAVITVDCAPGGVRDGQVQPRTAGTGAPVRYAFLPAEGTAPVRVRFTVGDGSLRTVFPPAPSPAYVLSRSLPDFHAPIFLKGDLAWNLVGMPIRALHALSLGDLAAASGADRLYVAAWKQGSNDAGSGAYVIGGPADSLPTGGGMWLAAGKETSMLPMGKVFSIPPGPDQAFSIRLVRGWNQIAAPILERLPWIVSKKDLAAYDQSPVKGLNEYAGNGKYLDADTLEPWKGYFVHSIIDTTVRLSARGAGSPKSAAGSRPSKIPATAGNGLKVLFEPVAYADGSVPAPIGLRLGAAAYAQDGLAREDEAMPTAPGQGAYLAAARDGQGLRTDVIGLHAEGLYAWKIAWTGRGEAARNGEPSRLKLTGLDLPEGLRLWAAAPSWNQDPGGRGNRANPVNPENGARRLSIGEVVDVPDLEGDTLAIWAASAGEWSPGDPIPGLAPVPAALAAGLVWGPQGGLLTVDLPWASAVTASIYAVDGRCLARLQRDRLAPGRHALPLSGVGRMRGLMFVVLDFRGAQGAQRMILRALAAAP